MSISRFISNFVLKSGVVSTVAVRIRPLPPDSEHAVNKSFKKSKTSDRRAWTLERTGATDSLIQKGATRKVGGRTIFHFDSVFDEETQTPLLYKRIARPMVKTVVCKFVFFLWNIRH
jgi:hypothetical protein